METVIRNASAIVTPSGDTDYEDPGTSIEYLEGKDIVVSDSRIVEITGSSRGHLNSGDYRIIDAGGLMVTPGFVDSHTHIMYCGKRTREFYMRLEGSTYSSILAEGGGILSTVSATRGCSPDELFSSTVRRVNSAVRTGTTTIEIKSGYGLNLESERKMIDTINRVKKTGPIRTIATALPMHAVPEGKSEKDYTEDVLKNILPELMAGSDFVDIFCDRGAFSVESAEELAEFLSGMDKGFRMHSGEIENIGCARLASKYRISSVDHLIHTDDADLEAMKSGGTTATLLPITAFSLGETIPDARKFRDREIPVSIATDSSPLTMSQNMLYAMHLGVRFCHMTPEEAFVGSTVNPSRSLGLMEETGTIHRGKSADLLFLNVEGIRDIAYMWDSDPVVKVMYQGRIIHSISEIT